MTSTAIHPPTAPPTNFDDFINQDMFAATAGGAQTTAPALFSEGSSSRASSRSPSDSFAQLPPTPPQPQLSSFVSDAGSTVPTFGEESFFNLHFDDAFDYMKNDPLATLSASMPFDFMNAFDNGAFGGQMNSSAASTSSLSPTSSGNASGATQSSFSGLAIDPQLVGTPAPSSAASNFGEDEEEDEDLDEDDLVLKPVKVGGKGMGRKGTLQSGGIAKKAPVDRMSKDDLDREKDCVPDDWRPSPEEYQKMSSKEKRQLRNKISARNFRVRRKGELIWSYWLSIGISSDLVSFMLSECV